MHLEALRHMAPRDKSNSEPRVPGAIIRKIYSYAISSFSDPVYFPTLGSSLSSLLLLLRLFLLFFFFSSSSFFPFFFFFFFFFSVSGVFCFRRSFSGSFSLAAGLSLVPFSCAVLCYFFLPAQRTSASALRHLLLGVVTKMCEGGGGGGW